MNDGQPREMSVSRARRINRQSGNVGNLGDIIKHAALVELASRLLETGSPVSFVDTHTFRLRAPVAIPVRFHRDLAAYVERYPAAARYASLERDHLERTGDYRCSSGLMFDVLGERRAWAVLGEANGRTRAELKEQLEEEGHQRVQVVDDARQVDRDGLVPGKGALLVHVDPFVLTPADFAPMAAALDALSARSSSSVFLLYSYRRSGLTEWPSPPMLTTLVAESRTAPHECAVYASADLAADARAIVAALGWRPR